MKKGRAATMTHDYKRHGTTTLFAALSMLDGTIISRCEQRHRHSEWLTLKDSRFNGPPPRIPDRAAPVKAGFRLPVRKQLRILPLAGAQPPDLVASAPGIPRLLQRAPKRTQREAGVAPHQVMR